MRHLEPVIAPAERAGAAPHRVHTAGAEGAGAAALTMDVPAISAKEDPALAGNATAEALRQIAPVDGTRESTKRSNELTVSILPPLRSASPDRAPGHYKDSEDTGPPVASASPHALPSAS